MSNGSRSLRHWLLRAIGKGLGFMLPSGALYVPENFEEWQTRGYHITPVHYYYPVPDTRELRRSYPRPASAPGVDLRAEAQKRLLTDSFPQFAHGYNKIPAQRTPPARFYLDNDAFAGIDPYVYYCMIACWQPKRIIEAGSGFSTLLALDALQDLGGAELTVIDPWPRRELFPEGMPRARHTAQRVESVDPDFFTQLEENDILFVDTSHVVRTAGDVCFLILEVLPRLAPGVIVHFHDIYLPFDYPEKVVLERHMFWTEQYLLQAYLTDNGCAEVLFGSHFAANRYPQELRAAFPNALWWNGASFWFRHV